MKVTGSIIIVSAILFAGAAYFFNCQAEGKMLTLADGRKVPMKCYWTAVAEISAAVPVLLIGGMYILSKRKEARRVLGILGTSMGALVIAYPTILIGVCGDMSGADCNLIMRPALILLGSIVAGASLISLFVSERRMEPAA